MSFLKLKQELPLDRKNGSPAVPIERFIDMKADITGQIDRVIIDSVILQQKIQHYEDERNRKTEFARMALYKVVNDGIENTKDDIITLKQLPDKILAFTYNAGIALPINFELESLSFSIKKLAELLDHFVIMQILIETNVPVDTDLIKNVSLILGFLVGKREREEERFNL